MTIARGRRLTHDSQQVSSIVIACQFPLHSDDLIAICYDNIRIDMFYIPLSVLASGILKYFLVGHTSNLVNMLLVTWVSSLRFACPYHGGRFCVSAELIDACF